MLFGILLFLHIVISLALMLVVLLQSGKGGGLAGAFGAAGGQTGQMLFGGRGAATFLSKATTVLGAAFLVTSLTLAVLQANRGGPRSVLDDVAIEPGTVTPLPTAPPPATEGLTLPEPATPTGGTAPATNPAAEGGQTSSPPETEGGGN